MQLQLSLRPVAVREVTAFVGCRLPIVSSRATLFADVAVALDADPRPRRAWVTSIERRHVDVVFRVVERDGERLAVLTEAARHVELGAREAFVADEGRLWGFRRDGARVDAIAAGANGALRSRTLGVDLLGRGSRVIVIPSDPADPHVVERFDRALVRVLRARLARAAS